MKDISESVIKKDHYEKMSGQAVYICDKKIDNCYFGKMVRSRIAHGKVKEIILPQLPEGYYSIDASDIPGQPGLKVIGSEQPIFANEEVKYLGESVIMIAGPDKSKVEEIAKQVEVIYEELPAALTIDDSIEDAVSYSYKKGENIDEIFQKAALVVEETFYTGYQEQAYIEPQGAAGIWHDGTITVYGSMQCPYYVRDALMQAMDLDEAHVQVIQTTTGGGFGGKEDYPSLICCQVAIASKKTGHPVKMILDRRDDMATTPKRHPGKLVYKAALDKNNTVIGIKADIKLNAGAYAGLSSVVLQRSLIAACGVYHIPNLDVKGAAVLTNTVSNGAYRGFGAPQSFFAIETLMNHLAEKVGENQLDFKMKHFVKQGDTSSTNGLYHHHVALIEMVEKADEMIQYRKKYKEYSKTQEGRYKKGIGMSIFLHGCGFTGAAEKELIKAKLKLVKYEDDTVEILASNTDIGQGLKTTFSKICARELALPLDNIKIVNPDTFRVPNSGPTVASRSLMITGKLIERAAKRLKAEWKSGEYQEIIEDYQHPDFMIPWDLDTFQGDAYPTYAYGINVVEVETDTVTGNTRLVDVAGVYDVGKCIDTTIMHGQAQGGMLQGIGYGSMEKMENIDGVIKQSSFTDYMIPTAMDTVHNKIAFIDNPYAGGPSGAKGAGELTLIGGAPAYEAAVEQAIGKPFYQIPVTPERIIKALAG